LRAGMNLGPELRQEFVRVHADDSIVAEEIGAAEGVMVADMVIHFP